MPGTTTPYIARQPGDLITAEDWNGLQARVQGDIASQVSAAKQDLKKSGVDRADNADKFASKSDTEWEQRLDKLYAPRDHNHEGQNVYRRYIKEFTTDPGMDEVLLRHNLGRYPLVDVYELLGVSDPAPESSEAAGMTRGCKLFFYYGHEDQELYNLLVKVYRDRVPLGLPFEGVLRELQVAYTDDTNLGDALNDMWDALSKDPNDEVKHGQSPWVEECCGESRTVGELKKTGQWDDLYLAIRPEKCVTLCGTPSPPARARPVRGGERETRLEASTVAPVVEITHVNYDTLLVTADVNLRTPLDLMFLLRI